MPFCRKIGQKNGECLPTPRDVPAMQTAFECTQRHGTLLNRKIDFVFALFPSYFDPYRCHLLHKPLALIESFQYSTKNAIVL